MSSKRYEIVPGEFPCHTCKEPVNTLRFYAEDKLLTWVCASKHMSEVSLKTKKTKRDYERTE